MPPLQTVRGTHDILPAEHRRHRHVVETARAIAARYGYEEMTTPIFEFTEVFQRTLGETSDIVTKEMYTFEDRGGDRITLRPEFTAGIVRALMSTGLRKDLPLKFFASGPMFRYERPQKGRLRQFHQLDVEVLGVADPLADVEIIALGAHILEALGLSGRVRCALNTLGDVESRTAYRSRLVDYLERYRRDLSRDSQVRLDRNPLRIFDSKDPRDREIIADAPELADDLNVASRRFFDRLQDGLVASGIEYVLDPRLVRGLDYYCHTAFEFVTDALGAQDAVLAGGRYDGLTEQLGGPPTPGTGWAAGIERLALLIAEPPSPPRPVAVIPVGENQVTEALRTVQRLRHAGFTVDMGFTGTVGRRMKRANKVNARVAVLLGSDELARAAATVRDMDTGTQVDVPLDTLEACLARHR